MGWLDRRVLALCVGALSTVLALVLTGDAYEPFLLLIGAVFVPLAGTFLTAYYVLDRGRWNVGDAAPRRYLMALPWVVGFAAYQVTAPTQLERWPGWGSFWSDVQETLQVSPTNGFSASLVSFVVAGLVTLLCGLTERLRSGTGRGGGAGVGVDAVRPNGTVGPVCGLAARAVDQARSGSATPVSSPGEEVGPEARPEVGPETQPGPGKAASTGG